MEKSKFISVWNELDDEMRLRWLAKTKDNQNVPEYEIHIDNDSVFLTFKDEEDTDEDDSTILYFDEFGYHLIPSMFYALGIKNAGMV